MRSSCVVFRVTDDEGVIRTCSSLSLLPRQSVQIDIATTQHNANTAERPRSHLGRHAHHVGIVVARLLRGVRGSRGRGAGSSPELRKHHRSHSNLHTTQQPARQTAQVESNCLVWLACMRVVCCCVALTAADGSMTIFMRSNTSFMCLITSSSLAVTTPLTLFRMTG